MTVRPAFATNIQVQLAQHKATQPESHWIKVVDLDAGGELAGAARWLVYERDPFKEGEEVVADWWPEASMGREFATKTLQQLDAPRGKMARRPHFMEMMPPTHLSPMWRPKGGKYSEGATVKPWETASNEA
ncbi:hypothetical protein CISG_06067 [Coccidioides immitis RMSCC 3703]|uniref:Uncharacterized protein n=1 Tax=Coccidioides immitis RMSCC 3703 TaxID=454286 RepID=A0A0J8R0P9_COCIT|nr:hypothetical protein CISG_06067 [Coccidioides immitis RMSCC 3703]